MRVYVRVVLLDAVDGHDMRVEHPGDRTRLAQEAVAEVGLRRERRWEQLDGDVAIERGLAGKDDDPHRAAAELPFDAIPACQDALEGIELAFLMLDKPFHVIGRFAIPRLAAARSE